MPFSRLQSYSYSCSLFTSTFTTLAPFMPFRISHFAFRFLHCHFQRIILHIYHFFYCAYILLAVFLLLFFSYLFFSVLLYICIAFPVVIPNFLFFPLTVIHHFPPHCSMFKILYTYTHFAVIHHS